MQPTGVTRLFNSIMNLLDETTNKITKNPKCVCSNCNSFQATTVCNVGFKMNRIARAPVNTC